MKLTIGVTLNQMEYALAVEKTGSFSAAARECHVSQPSLSEMIQKLESSLEVILFDRKKSPVGATEVGKILLTQMRTTLVEAQRLAELAQDWKKETKGHLRIGLIPTLAPSLVPLFLKGLRKKYPEMSMAIVESPTNSLLDLLQKGDIDCAILSTPENAPEHLTEKLLFYEPFVVYASRDNVILKRKEVGFSDLSTQEVLLMDETHCLRDQTLALCGLKKTRPAKQTTIQGGMATLLSVVDQENCMTFIPELTAENLGKDVRKSQLRVFEQSRFSRKVSLLFNKTYLKRKMIDLLYEEIRENLPESVAIKKERGAQVIDPRDERFDVDKGRA